MASLAQEAIRNSFIRLISEKTFDKITVKEVIDDCQIARRTFYYHYQDLYAVLEEILRMESEKAIQEYRSGGSWEDAFIRASQFILENRRAVYHLYYSEHRMELMRYIDGIASEIMDRFICDLAGDRKIQQEDEMLLAAFYKSALSGILLQWLESGMKSDPERAVRRLGVLLGGDIERALQISADEMLQMSV